MKRSILTGFIAITFLFAGVQAVFAQTDAAGVRGNAAPVEALPQELKTVDVKDFYITAAGPPAGWIRTVIGHVVVQHEDTGQAYFAAAGDAIFPKDIVFTLKDSRCRLKFTTDDIITMGDNGRIGIEEYMDDRAQQKKTTVFSMLRGKAMFYALRLFKYRSVSSSVKTPTAIIGVRGTQFGVEVRKVGDKMASARPVYLADASDSGHKYLLAQQDGVEVVTHCLDGSIVASFAVVGGPSTNQMLLPSTLPPGLSTILTPGQSLQVTADGVGEVYSTPNDVLAAFIQATAAPDPQAATDQGQPAAPAPVAAAAGPAAGDTGAADPTDTSITDKNQDIVQTTTGQTVETQGRPRKGYFAGMLTDRFSTPYLDNAYVSNTLQDFNSEKISAKGLLNEEGFIDGYPGTGFTADPLLNQVGVDDDTLVSAANLNLAVITGPMGSNDYMEWGWWYVVDTFIINSIVHDLWHKGYYIAGSPTPDDVASGISGTYSGKAWGTYYNPTGSTPQGIDMVSMEGDFNCNLSVMGGITSFDMSVSGGGKSASISGGSGSLNSSSFEITGGTWLINGAPALYKSAAGSLYGPNGEHIGGAWGMKKDSANGAVGIFKGDKQPLP